ncbi:MAG: DsrE family protein [Candidatus Methanofastidiosa archaeon]|nr:DsrE family protein [Candidatus Methanofastidiosa archaeon]
MVESKKTLALMLFAGPYGKQDADHMCRIAESALKRGYGVRIFLYGDGVHAQMNGQNPLSFLNIGEYLTKLNEMGAEIKSCVRCSTARGYKEGEFDELLDRYPSSKAIDAVKIYTLYSFIDMIRECDRIMTFGGI